MAERTKVQIIKTMIPFFHFLTSSKFAPVKIKNYSITLYITEHGHPPEFHPDDKKLLLLLRVFDDRLGIFIKNNALDI